MLRLLRDREGVSPVSFRLNAGDEAHLEVRPGDFRKACLFAHNVSGAPVSTLFAEDQRAERRRFFIRCVFCLRQERLWLVISAGLDPETPEYDSLANDIFSAALFEREADEMFGLKRRGAFDDRPLRLHPEVWPEGFHPLRKDFRHPGPRGQAGRDYAFRRVEGEGVFEVPVGPVHAGIIGPGHFRFSAAGEPVLNLEIRLGFTHRGAEKLFEGRTAAEALAFSELVDGEAAFAHSLAFSDAVEKICGVKTPEEHLLARGILLELERMYNHAGDLGGLATDVGFGFPAACAAALKEDLLALNGKLAGSRYLKGFNRLGGTCGLTVPMLDEIEAALASALKDFSGIMNILYGSASFMDRVEETGVLPQKTAAELGVSGPAARASGIAWDMREFSPLYRRAGFRPARQAQGDVLARLRVRAAEFEESARLARGFSTALRTAPRSGPVSVEPVEGCALGCAESWRGPVLCWVRLGRDGRVERCKVTDPSFLGWEGLAQAVPGNIIPDFPLCNKSFNLSYPGNDL